MSLSPTFIRFLFIGLTFLVLAAYTLFLSHGDMSPFQLAALAGATAAFGAAMLLMDKMIRSLSLKSFLVLALGLFFGVMMGEALFSLIKELPLAAPQMTLLRAALLLFTSYAGVMITNWSAAELALSLPYVQFHSLGKKKKEMLLDLSILMDPRILDLANSGLVDGQLLLPRFLVKELQATESDPKSKKCLETLKKLEQMENLDLKTVDQDFSDMPDTFSKLIKLARLLEANLLTADINRIQQAQIEGIRIVNIHLLANALKPISQSGEQLDIKVQRPGKEPRQGVGYLDDGTMVVINGGAAHLGQTIRCQVLSVKHTASGRLIFCNAPDEPTGYSSSFEGMEHSPSQYFVQDYERNRL